MTQTVNNNLDYSAVFSAIAAIQDPEWLALKLRARATEPDYEQDPIMPVFFPSRSPSIRNTDVIRWAGGDSLTFTGTVTYELNFVYLHIKKQQNERDNVKPNQYSQVILSNIGAIYRGILRNGRSLVCFPPSTSEILPGQAAIDLDVISPKGEAFLGATFNVKVIEIVQF